MNHVFYLWEIDLGKDRTLIVGGLYPDLETARAAITQAHPDRGTLDERHDNLTVRWMVANRPPDERIQTGQLYVYSFSRY